MMEIVYYEFFMRAGIAKGCSMNIMSLYIPKGELCILTEVCAQECRLRFT